jgi:DNA-binding GntR family transcriptional regulator
MGFDHSKDKFIKEKFFLPMGTGFTKKQKKEVCYQTLKAQIVTGILKPGNSLGEKELMEAFSIGRTPLREVLLRFQTDGLIIRVPRGGTAIAPLDIKGFIYLMETRMPLELFAGELACKRITSHELTDLKTQLDRLNTLAKKRDAEYAFARLEIAFHAAVYKTTQNPELAKLLEQLHDKCARVWYCLTRGSQEVSFGMDDLCELLEALSTRDVSRVKKVTKRHLNTFKNQVEKRINT